jgi:hypothetical protein
LVERCLRKAEVGGSIPLISTIICIRHPDLRSQAPPEPTGGGYGFRHAG